MAVLLFTPQLAATAPKRFMQRLYAQVRMRGVWVGPDFALGRDRSGDVSNLRRLGREMGFQVHEMPYVTEDGEKVSSTHIRLLVRRGRVTEARRLLGRFYSISGEVVHGAQRGRCLGFPTANVAVHPERVVPANGIYASIARLGSDHYPSVTSIGVRPTFDNGERSIEAYLLDFQGDLYGRDLVIEFVARLRPERRFAEVGELVAQIERDVAETRGVLDAQLEAERR
jgi:riboflavin kinase/FMN adenylyltransferase